MYRSTILLATSAFLALSLSALGQTIDPVGFCPPPATVATCSTATGSGNETIGVSGTTFAMMKTGNTPGTAVNPWELLVAIPDYTGAAPTISSTSFTLAGVTNVGDFLPTTQGSLYTFAGTSGDSSMNAPNLFCDGASYPCTSSNEISAFGSLPTFFDVFAYSFSPSIADKTAYTFTVGGAGLPGGTYLAAAGGSNPFTTPFTTAGLVEPSAVPEPSSIVLLATLQIIGCGLVIRKVGLKLV